MRHHGRGTLEHGIPTDVPSRAADPDGLGAGWARDLGLGRLVVSRPSRLVGRGPATGDRTVLSPLRFAASWDHLQRLSMADERRIGPGSTARGDCGDFRANRKARPPGHSRRSGLPAFSANAGRRPGSRPPARRAGKNKHSQYPIFVFFIDEKESENKKKGYNGSCISRTGCSWLLTPIS